MQWIEMDIGYTVGVPYKFVKVTLVNDHVEIL